MTQHFPPLDLSSSAWNELLEGVSPKPAFFSPNEAKTPLAVSIQNLRKSQMVILVDDEDRENEGDLVLAGQFATSEAINFMATHARGLICLAMESQRIAELDLPMMTHKNNSPRQTAFTVSIEAKEGVTTGISAYDRAKTIQVACDPSKKAQDLVSPGHIFPLRAVPGGVLVRAGHTEGSTDLMRLAGLYPAAVICEIMKEDGSMARRQDLEIMSKKFNLPIISIQDIIAYRVQHESLVEEVAHSKLPSIFSPDTPFEMHAFRSLVDGTEHLLLRKGSIQNPMLTRVHSECLTGEALGSLRCDCGPQLQAALRQISQAGQGVLLYMRKHEGRGIGLGNKVKAYALQDQGMDTVQANEHLGFKADLRHYGIGAQILKKIGIHEIDLLTNNPKKVVGLEGYGLRIRNRVPIEIPPNPFNQQYLETKQNKMGHSLHLTSKKGEQS